MDGMFSGLETADPTSHLGITTRIDDCLQRRSRPRVRDRPGDEGAPRDPGRAPFVFQRPPRFEAALRSSGLAVACRRAAVVY